MKFFFYSGISINLLRVVAVHFHLIDASSEMSMKIFKDEQFPFDEHKFNDAIYHFQNTRDSI